MTGYIGKERFHINLAKIKKDGHTFEIDIDPDLAMEFKEGKKIDISEVLKVEHIFSDAKKGELASDKLMEKVFGSSDPLVVAEKIIKEGEVQESQHFRDEKTIELKKQIIGIIHMNAVDPVSKHPHPMTRIENAFAEAKVKIDENHSAHEQIPSILKQLRTVLPIKFETKVMEIKVPAKYAGKVNTSVRLFGTVTKETWLPDSSWLGVVEIPGGLEQDLYDNVNNMTHGTAEIKEEENKKEK